MTRAFELVEIELTGSGKERAAIKNDDLAALWHEGWGVAFCWIATKKEIVDGTPKGQTRQFLFIMMGPPRQTPTTRSMDAVAAALEAARTPEPGPPTPGPSPLLYAAVVAPWLLLIIGIAIAWQS